MTVDRHTTIIEADVSLYLAAEGKLQTATTARLAAARQLASVQNEAEMRRIAALVNSENAEKRAAGLQREALGLARQKLALAKQEEAAVKAGIAAEEQRTAAIRASQAAAEKLAQTSKTGLLSMGA